VKLFHAAETHNPNSANGTIPSPETVIPKGVQTIVYAGTLEAYQGIDVLLDAFVRVRNIHSDALLTIIGGNTEQVQQYTLMAQQKGISDSCVFTGTVSPELARRYNRSATVLVSPRLTGLNTPLKIYEQLASGIPLVATNIYAHTQVLDQNTTFLAEPTSTDLARAITEALSSIEGYRRAENAKRLYLEKYSRAAYVEKMQKLLERLA
jgi:glycosyltransferase involved in cell wall biosynthesis